MDDDTQMLADLGQKVLNAIVATERLGHTNMRHTLRYLHTDDPSGLLVKAVIDGNAENAIVELRRWLAAARQGRRTA